MNCLQCLKSVAQCACVGGAYLPNSDSKKWGQEEYDAHVEKLRTALAPAQDALRFLSKHHPTGFRSSRMPIGVIGKDFAPGGVAYVVVSPDVAFRPTHLVVSHETSKAFNLVQITVGCVSRTAGGYDVPLESFAMDYLAELKGEELKAIMGLQKWDLGIVTPAMRVQVCVRNIGTCARAFRGLLWGDAADIC